MKTQVQIPDHLYREAKRIAEEYEMSFAEVVRRGLERMSPLYPPRRERSEVWERPRFDEVTLLITDGERLRDLARELPDVGRSSLGR